MSYEKCPKCGSQKHQVNKCPKCGFQRNRIKNSIKRFVTYASSEQMQKMAAKIAEERKIKPKIKSVKIKSVRNKSIWVKCPRSYTKTELESEIKKLELELRKTAGTSTPLIRSRLRELKNELTHRISGYRRPRRIVSGGAIGLAK